MIYQRIIKRIFDLFGAVIAILLLSPIIILIAIAVRVKLGAPILYRQERPGYHTKIFLLYKFRTMTNQHNKAGELLEDSLRITKFGRLLRSASLDELPELINILKGDMSFIGPRPLLTKYLPLYNEHQSLRHMVKPGLSGLAQVNGRNSLTWEEKFNLDIHYVKNISFRMDVIIFITTIIKVVRREGVNSKTSVTMEEFMGNTMQRDKDISQKKP